MKTDEDKLLEKFLDNVLKDSALETPSIDFTTEVMSKVELTKKSNVFVYMPLISKPIFVLIFGCFIVLFIYFFKNSETQTDSWVNYLYFRTFFSNYSTSLFNFSKITIYSVVFVTLLLFIQISFLKKHFDNQINQ